MSRLRTPFSPVNRRFSQAVGVGNPNENGIDSAVDKALRRYAQRGGSVKSNVRPQNIPSPPKITGGGPLPTLPNPAGQGAPSATPAVAPEGQFGGGGANFFAPNGGVRTMGPTGYRPASEPTKDSPANAGNFMAGIINIRKDAERQVGQMGNRPVSPVPLYDPSDQVIAGEARAKELRGGQRVSSIIGRPLGNGRFAGGQMTHAQAIAGGPTASADFLGSAHAQGQRLIRSQREADRALTSPLGGYPAFGSLPGDQPEPPPYDASSGPNAFRRARKSLISQRYPGAQTVRNVTNPNSGGIIPEGGSSADYDPLTSAITFESTRKGKQDAAMRQEAQAVRTEQRPGAPLRAEGELASDYIKRFRQENVMPILDAKRQRHKDAISARGAKRRAAKKGISMRQAMQDVGGRYPGPPIDFKSQLQAGGQSSSSGVYSPGDPVSQEESASRAAYVESTKDSPLSKKYGLGTGYANDINKSLMRDLRAGALRGEDLQSIKQSLISRESMGGFRKRGFFGGDPDKSPLVDSIMQGPDFTKMSPKSIEVWLQRQVKGAPPSVTNPPYGFVPGL